MKNGKHLIAFCVGDLQYAETAHMANIMSAVAEEHNCLVYIYNMSSIDDNGSCDIYRLINYKETDGVIIFSRSIDNKPVYQFIAQRAIEHDVPTVTIDGPVEGCINIQYEYGDAFAEIVRHVVEVHGCRRIDLMSGIKGNKFSDERTKALFDVLAEKNIPSENVNIYYGSFWHDPTVAAMEELLANEPELPDAIICANDAMAIAVCEVLNNRGYTVPGHVIVTGFDGTPEGQSNFPRLTTSQQHLTLACRSAVEAILNGTSAGTDITIPFTLLYGQSCGCSAAKAFDQNTAIQNLTNEISCAYGYGDYIINLGNRVITANDMTEIEAIIREFSFDRALICVNESFFDFSREMTYDPEKPFDQTMRVIAHRGLMTSYLGETVKFGDIIPASTLDEGIKTVPLSLSTIRFGNITLGYVALPLFDERRYYRMLNKYLRMLSQSLTMVHSTQYMIYLFSHDHLTGLLNRRGFFKQMHNMIEENIGNDFILNIYSVDIDNLKMINDTYGHSEGDYAIKSIADSLVSAAGTDSYIIARFGGDKFISASICSKDNSSSVEYIDNLNDCLDALNQISMKPYKLVASCGFSSTEITHDIKIDDVISTADMMMYSEKAEHKRSSPRKN